MEKLGQTLRRGPHGRKINDSARLILRQKYAASLAAQPASTSGSRGVKPRWWLRARAASLPPESRIRCRECFGRGSNAGLALEVCRACQEADYPCAYHRCRVCNGCGEVCPDCRGDRVLRIHEWEIGIAAVEWTRCDTCCEGNQINPAKERKAIERWRLKGELSIVQPTYDDSAGSE